VCINKYKYIKMYYYSVDIRGNYKKAAYIGHWISSIKIYSTLSEEKKGTKAVTGAVLFKKGKLLSILGANMEI